MIIEHEGRLYSLAFRHSADTDGRFTRSTMAVVKRSVSASTAPDASHAWETILVGIAVCHPQDQFCKETGRRRALRTAYRKLCRIRGHTVPRKLRETADDPHVVAAQKILRAYFTRGANDDGKVAHV